MTSIELLRFITHSNAIEEKYSKEAFIDSVLAWEFLEQQTELNLYIIKETHRFIMHRINPNIAGLYRNEAKQNVLIGNKLMLHFNFVQIKLSDLLMKANIFSPKKFHIKFERIHPFIDGNGRVGRLIWLWHREKLKLPFKLIQYKNKDKYYNWFKKKERKIK